MRLIPDKLLKVAPRKQLLGQVREYTAMCKDIYVYGRVNHILINKINNYSINDFIIYGIRLNEEMNKRGYKITDKTINKWKKYLNNNMSIINNKPIFINWFNDRYIRQVLYNWQEKYDCGGISVEEWNIVLNNFKKYIVN